LGGGENVKYRRSRGKRRMWKEEKNIYMRKKYKK